MSRITHNRLVPKLNKHAFCTDSHKKTAENCHSYPKILNAERWGVLTLKVKKNALVTWIPSGWDR